MEWYESKGGSEVLRISEDDPDSEWARRLIIGGRRFLAREFIKLPKKENRFLFEEKWIHIEELPYVPETEIDDETSLFRDIRDGSPVLVLTEDVPTFDSGDRMYDSMHRAFIKRDGETLNAFFLSCGYRLGSAEIFLGVRPMNGEAEETLRRTGFLTAAETFPVK